jgi:hypothetical protein
MFARRTFRLGRPGGKLAEFPDAPQVLNSFAIINSRCRYGWPPLDITVVNRERGSGVYHYSKPARGGANKKGLLFSNNKPLPENVFYS